MIRLRNVTLDVMGEFLFSVDHFDFEKGKRYLLVGDNGTGKSSLLKSLIHRFEFCQGSIESEGEIIYQPQESYLFQKTVKDNFKLVGMAEAEMVEGLSELFAEDILEKKVRVLSGGQQQKTTLLRSLHRAKDILLLDEPFSQMDEKSSLAAQALVMRWHEEVAGRILVIISHDVELSEIDFDVCICLHDKTFLAGDPECVI